MTLVIQPQLTLEEFLKFPETETASEFFQGKITKKPMPQGEHSVIQGELCKSINQVAKSQKVAYAFPELRCTFAGVSIVPDVTVFRWARIPLLPSGRIVNRFEINPDWSIEILSPEQSQTKILGKLIHCINQGTELGWLIDPEAESILALFPGQIIELYQGEKKLPVLAGIELELTAEMIFDWLKLS